MEYLKFERDGWIYRHAEEGATVEIEVSYTLGGVNFFHDRRTPRGIYVSLRPVRLEKRPDGSMMRSYTLLGSRSESGGRLHVLDLARKSQRQMDRIALLVDSAAPTIASLWMEGKLNEAIRLLERSLSPVMAQAV